MRCAVKRDGVDLARPVDAAEADVFRLRTADAGHRAGGHRRQRDAAAVFDRGVDGDLGDARREAGEMADLDIVAAAGVARVFEHHHGGAAEHGDAVGIDLGGAVVEAARAGEVAR